MNFLSEINELRKELQAMHDPLFVTIDVETGWTNTDEFNIKVGLMDMVAYKEDNDFHRSNQYYLKMNQEKLERIGDTMENLVKHINLTIQNLKEKGKHFDE